MQRCSMVYKWIRATVPRLFSSPQLCKGFILHATFNVRQSENNADCAPWARPSHKLEEQKAGPSIYSPMAYQQQLLKPHFVPQPNRGFNHVRVVKPPSSSSSFQLNQQQQQHQRSDVGPPVQSIRISYNARVLERSYQAEDR